MFWQASSKSFIYMGMKVVIVYRIRKFLQSLFHSVRSFLAIPHVNDLISKQLGICDNFVSGIYMVDTWRANEFT